MVESTFIAPYTCIKWNSEVISIADGTDSDLLTWKSRNGLRGCKKVQRTDTWDKVRKLQRWVIDGIDLLQIYNTKVLYDFS